MLHHPVARGVRARKLNKPVPQPQTESQRLSAKSRRLRWAKAYDDDRHRYYYYQDETGDSKWRRPRAKVSPKEADDTETAPTGTASLAEIRVETLNKKPAASVTNATMDREAPNPRASAAGSSSADPGRRPKRPVPPADKPTGNDEFWIVADDVCMTIGICICWGAAIG